MKDKLFTKLLQQVQLLTDEQKNTLIKTIEDQEKSVFELIDQEFTQNPKCPTCSSVNIYRWGKVDGLQRYRCKECKRTFNALSGTSMSRLRKKELWMEYSQALADSLSLTKAAEKCGVNRTTAFRWRHRFLPMSTKAQNCSGITEIDETYFRESFKGKKVQHRDARKRGKSTFRGLSKEQIPVVIAKDRNGNICDAVLKQRNANEVSKHFKANISKNSVLCIEKSRILLKFAKDNGLAYEAINAKQRKGRERVFHVQGVNAYHSRLKRWMTRFNGVATERLTTYLEWRRLHEDTQCTPQEWLKTMVSGKIHTLRN